MFLELGRDAWLVAMAQASVYFDPGYGRGAILSPRPEALNPQPMAVDLCIDLAPVEFSRLVRCRTEPRLLDIAHELLAMHWPEFQREWEQGLSRDGAGFDNPSETPFALARSMFQHAEEIGPSKDSAVVAALAYSLLGVGVRRRRRIETTAGCWVCWFRNRVPGSRYCFFHQYSHQRKGRENPYALRRREKRIKILYFPREGAWRDWFRYYLIRFATPREEWAPILIAYVVSEMSLQWLDGILADCPNVRGDVAVEIRTLVAGRDWAGLFEMLRSRFDPWDYRTNLDHWCAKLLEAEAWLSAEREVAGRWSAVPVHGKNGQLLRSGQHVAGKRGPKQATLEQMERVIELARQGCDRESIAIALGIQRRTLTQWEQRHPEFEERLKFHLRQHPLQRSHS